jgi:hypothetical protein
VAVTVVV